LAVMVFSTTVGKVRQIRVLSIFTKQVLYQLSYVGWLPTLFRQNS
jgi:hypothetical protein